MNWDSKYGFKTERINCKDDFEGKVFGTLICRNSTKPSKKAILYIHGFVDYFYQNHLADWANDFGFNFYAIDLRRHGRSILPHHKPNMTRDLREYFEEIDIAINIIRNNDGNHKLVLIGHSTGGLISSLYAHDNSNNNNIDAIILNSPFFDFNKPPLFKKIILPIVAKLGLKFPNLPSPEGLKEGYVKSIHCDHFGEWDFDFDLKPLHGFKINLGWIAAIYYSQKRLQKGLKIPCPVLVMYSSKSFTPGNYSKEMHNADSVLNVSDISKYAEVIGNNIATREIKGGVHDLILSNKSVRTEVFTEMTNFIAKSLTK